jgi:hypothetical protein
MVRLWLIGFAFFSVTPVVESDRQIRGAIVDVTGVAIGGASIRQSSVSTVSALVTTFVSIPMIGIGHTYFSQMM